MATTPRYREIADELRDAILGEQELLSVQLTGGAKLPTEPELGEHFGASRGTIRQAIAQLAAEGLTESRGRAGLYVRRLRMLEHSAHYEHPDRKGTADSWSAEVRRSGAEPSQDFSFRIVPASNGVAERLRIENEELVVVREMLRYVDGIPYSLQTSYYPYDIAKECGLDVPRDIGEGTVRRMASIGYRELGWADQVSSRPATAEEAQTFELAPGVAVIIYRRVAWTDQRPIRLTRETLPADRNLIAYESGDLSAKRAAEDGDSAGSGS